MTQKPLQEMIPEIIDHIDNVWENNIIYNRELYEMYEGQVLNYIEEEIKRTGMSDRAFQKMRNRIPPINLLKDVTDKRSKVYVNQEVIRTTSETNEPLLNYWEEETDLNNVLAELNCFLNLHRYAGLEYYTKKGMDGKDKPCLRVLGGHEFIPYSDDPVNPSKPTVMVKFMYTYENDKDARSTKVDTQRVDRKASKTMNAAQEWDEVNRFHFISDKEFYIVDVSATGKTKGQFMIVEHETQGVNPYGVNTIQMITSSKREIIPYPDSSLKRMSLLLPILMADLNYAIEFLSHSLVYGIDIDIVDAQANPDAIMLIDSVDKEGAKPTIGTIEPKVQIPETLNLISSQYQLWLHTLDLKASQSIGANSVGDIASGVSKYIDMSDTMELMKKQSRQFSNFEKNQVWQMIKNIHNSKAVSFGKGLFSNDFTVNVEYIPEKPMEDENTKMDKLKKKLDNGFTSYRRALMEANPHLDEKGVDKLIEEIKQEKQERMLENQALISNNENEEDKDGGRATEVQPEGAEESGQRE